MRLIFFFASALLVQSAIAQNPQIIKTVSNTTLEPESDAQLSKRVRPWNGKLFYPGKGTATQAILAVTDGTTAGTMVVKDLGDVGGVDGVYPAQDFVFFTTLKAEFPAAPPFVVTYTRRIWRSDGTAAGTTLLKAFSPTTGAANTGVYSSDALSSVNLSVQGNNIFFSAYDASTGIELWKSDGTAAGTVQVKDILPGSGNSNPIGFCQVGGVTCFFASEGNNSYQLWKTDGTDAGTSIVTRINPSASSIAEFSAGLYRGRMYFWANDGVTGAEIWSTDGTASGTRLLKETVAGNNAFTGSGGMRTDIVFIQDDRYLYFPSERYKYVWRTDGTSAGTIRLNQTELSSQTSAGASARGNRIYWLDNTTTLYASNGTEAGTSKVVTNLSQAGQLYNYKNAAWFQARPPAAFFDAEPWRSDGSPTNTARAFDIYGGSASSDPNSFFELNGFLYFFGTNSTGKHLFRYNGDMTFNGTQAGNRWRDSANWNSFMPPGITDTAFIPAGFTAVVTGINASVGTLVMGAGAGVSLAAANDTLFIQQGVSGGTVTGPGLTVLHSNLSDTVRVNGPFTGGNMMVGGNVSLQAALTAGGHLTLSGGSRVWANNNDLLLSGAASSISGAGSDAYIVTNGSGSLRVDDIGPGGRGGAISFPIGTSSNYNPVTITNIGSSDQFRARVQEGVAPSYAGENPSGSSYIGNVVNNTWMIAEASPGGSNATISLQWNSAQELTGFNRSQSQLGHYTGGSWQLSAAAAATGSEPYTRTESGITSFSPFSVFTGSGAQGGTAVENRNSNSDVALRQIGNRVYIDLRTAWPQARLRLINAAAQTLYSAQYRGRRNLELELPQVAGIYYLIIFDGKTQRHLSRVLVP